MDSWNVILECELRVKCLIKKYLLPLICTDAFSLKVLSYLIEREAFSVSKSQQLISLFVGYKLNKNISVQRILKLVTRG